jgi:hypothetical protein
MKVLYTLDIIEEYLNKNGFDGLYCEGGECACMKDDLAPCGQIEHDCAGGYLQDKESNEYDFIIAATKPKRI